MRTWRTLHQRRILHAPGAISVHGGVSPRDSRTRALRPGALPSEPLWPDENGANKILRIDQFNRCHKCFS